jgi:hypothetical protein
MVFQVMHIILFIICSMPLQVKYKNVMKQYNLGPNGGILTSCNLFATRFDQVGSSKDTVDMYQVGSSGRTIEYVVSATRFTRWAAMGK